MGYRLAVDLGTTFTAAAVGNGGQPAMLGLGNRALQVPSVLYLDQDGEFACGEVAERRGAIQPHRVAREFKRRIGDPVPMLVAGHPFSPQALTARMLSWVLATATERQGGPPDQVVLTHPANWGGYKRELLNQVIALSDLPGALICSEPEAAAIQYASRARLQAGAKIAVYDLGGGTFDACVLELLPTGFTILGSPDGIEHLGGIDFDEAVFGHVRRALDDRYPNFESDDTSVISALTRLRRDCVDAKEALSSDLAAIIPVNLPGLSTHVRLTRAEFEELIEPALKATLSAMRRALRSAGTSPDDLATIVLVGGSSRIPLVSHLLRSEFGIDPSVDTHPKHDVALGAALFQPPASRSAMPARPTPPRAMTRPNQERPPAKRPDEPDGGDPGTQHPKPLPTPPRLETSAAGSPPHQTPRTPAKRRSAKPQPPKVDHERGDQVTPTREVGRASGSASRMVAALKPEPGAQPEKPLAGRTLAILIAVVLAVGGVIAAMALLPIDRTGSDSSNGDSPVAGPTATGPVSWASVTAGDARACAVRTDGSAACWGSNRAGELGDGTTTHRPEPVFLDDNQWASLSAGDDVTCGVRTDGRAACWGSNSSGELGDGSGAGQFTPHELPYDDWLSITAGGGPEAQSHVCGIRRGGAGVCWGDNRYGQIGDGTNVDRFEPFALKGSWKMLSAGGGHTCGVRTDGTAACWGNNDHGQIGDGTTVDRQRPRDLSGSSWETVAAGWFHTCGLHTDGTAACWGSNGVGELGDGSKTQRQTPQTVPWRDDPRGIWKAITTGGNFTCALRTNGRAACWGSNTRGQFGDDTVEENLSPTRIGPAGLWTSLDAGWRHTCGVAENGTAACWGNNRQPGEDPDAVEVGSFVGLEVDVNAEAAD